MSRKSALLWSGAAGLFAALPLALWLLDFTVDDALIPLRYARNLHQGLGYRFNPHGPSSDGVTPLAWPYLFAPFARGTLVELLGVAKGVGFVAWCCAAWTLGTAIGGISGSRWRFATLALLATSAPLAAWSVAGLETGVATALATLAVTRGATARGAIAASLAAGLAAWLRPEMLLFAFVIGVAHGSPTTTREATSATRSRTAIASLALAVGPWMLAAGIRYLAWGRPFPLALLAKPSDFTHGAAYLGACLLLTGAPVAALTAGAVRWQDLDRSTRTVVVACAAHALAIAVAGGDWMPLSRLMVPILPALVLVTARCWAFGPSPVLALGLVLGLAGEAWTVARVGPDAARVGAARRELIAAAAPALAPLHRVAALDIGWVGAATTAEIVDLAGLTDPEIAALPGGHTSKAVSMANLLGRGVDGVMVLLVPTRDDSDEQERHGVRPGVAERPASVDRTQPPEPSEAARGVERRLLADPGAGMLRAVWRSPDALPNRYVLLARP